MSGTSYLLPFAVTLKTVAFLFPDSLPHSLGKLSGRKLPTVLSVPSEDQHHTPNGTWQLMKNQRGLFSSLQPRKCWQAPEKLSGTAKVPSHPATEHASQEQSPDCRKHSEGSCCANTMGMGWASIAQIMHVKRSKSVPFFPWGHRWEATLQNNPVLGYGVPIIATVGAMVFPLNWLHLFHS